MKEIITRGTTPAFSFTLPFAAEQVKSLFLTFCQGNKRILEKSLEDCRKDDCVVCVTLTQTETFLFDEKQNVNLQLRLTDSDGNAFASPVFTLGVKNVLKGGTI